VFICAAGDIHGAMHRLYDDVLAFEESLSLLFDCVLHVGDFGVWPDPRGSTEVHASMMAPAISPAGWKKERGRLERPFSSKAIMKTSSGSTHSSGPKSCLAFSTCETAAQSISRTMRDTNSVSVASAAVTARQTTSGNPKGWRATRNVITPEMRLTVSPANKISILSCSMTRRRAFNFEDIAKVGVTSVRQRASTTYSFVSGRASASSAITTRASMPMSTVSAVWD
jgi:hypothetical protein